MSDILSEETINDLALSADRIGGYLITRMLVNDGFTVCVVDPRVGRFRPLTELEMLLFIGHPQNKTTYEGGALPERHAWTYTPMFSPADK